MRAIVADGCFVAIQEILCFCTEDLASIGITFS